MSISGGGSGWLFDYLKNSIEIDEIEKYTILELGLTCSFFSKLHNHPVDYLTKLPAGFRTDILYTNSALQYLVDDNIFISIVNTSEPGFVLIEDFLGVDVRTFFTIQNYYESRIIVKIRNTTDFLQRFQQLGYFPLMIVPTVNEILKKIQPLPMENFPLDHNVGYPRTLLLGKSGIHLTR